MQQAGSAPVRRTALHAAWSLAHWHLMQASENQPTLIDARGLRCPIPALRLARAVREGGPGRYILLADDPAASQDIPALCYERGWQLEASAPGECIPGDWAPGEFRLSVS